MPVLYGSFTGTVHTALLALQSFISIQKSPYFWTFVKLTSMHCEPVLYCTVNTRGQGQLFPTISGISRFSKFILSVKPTVFVMSRWPTYYTYQNYADFPNVSRAILNSAGQYICNQLPLGRVKYILYRSFCTVQYNSRIFQSAPGGLEIKSPALLYSLSLSLSLSLSFPFAFAFPVPFPVSFPFAFPIPFPVSFPFAFPFAFYFPVPFPLSLLLSLSLYLSLSISLSIYLSLLGT